MRNEMTPGSGKARWPLATRVAFRFTFIYLALFIFPFPFDLGDVPVGGRQSLFVDKVVPWFNTHVTHISISGHNARILVFLLISAVVTVIWSVVDRHRLNYTTAHQWLRL